MSFPHFSTGRTLWCVLALFMAARHCDAQAVNSPGESIPRTTVREVAPDTDAGIVSEVASADFVVLTENGGTPVRYTSSPATVYVDEAGGPVARALVTIGLPVTVQFTRAGERRLASRVTVRRQTGRKTIAPTVIEPRRPVVLPPAVAELPIMAPKEVPLIVVEKKARRVPVESTDRPGAVGTLERP